MDTRLVFYVNLHRKIAKEGANAVLFLLLRFGSQILGIEINNVDVPDTVIRRVTEFRVPHRLYDSSRYEPAVRQPNITPSVDHGSKERARLDNTLHKFQFGRAQDSLPGIPQYRGILSSDYGDIYET